MQRVVALMAMVAIGLGFYLYPQAYQWNQIRIDRNANLSVVQIAQKTAPNTQNDLLQAAQQYNYDLWAFGNTDFREADAANDQDYQAQLGNAIGSVSIPNIDITLPIYHGATEDILAMGAGHVYGTSLPIGGKNTHAVITAHSRQGQAGRFNRIREMQIGDEFFVTAAGQTIRYVVDQINTVLPSETDYLKIIPGEDHATLLTCTPLGLNTHRLLVRGVRADLPGLASDAPPLGPMPFPLWAAWLAGGVTLAGVVGGIVTSATKPKGAIRDRCERGAAR